MPSRSSLEASSTWQAPLPRGFAAGASVQLTGDRCLVAALEGGRGSRGAAVLRVAAFDRDGHPVFAETHDLSRVPGGLRGDVQVAAIEVYPDALVVRLFSLDRDGLQPFLVLEPRLGRLRFVATGFGLPGVPPRVTVGRRRLHAIEGEKPKALRLVVRDLQTGRSVREVPLDAADVCAVDESWLLPDLHLAPDALWLATPNRVCRLDAETGEERWSVRHLKDRGYEHHRSLVGPGSLHQGIVVLQRLCEPRLDVLDATGGPARKVKLRALEPPDQFMVGLDDASIYVVSYLGKREALSCFRASRYGETGLLDDWTQPIAAAPGEFVFVSTLGFGSDAVLVPLAVEKDWRHLVVFRPSTGASWYRHLEALPDDSLALADLRVDPESETLVICSEACLTGLDLRTGETRYTLAQPERFVLELAHGRLVCLDADGGLRWIDAREGRTLHTHLVAAAAGAEHLACIADTRGVFVVAGEMGYGIRYPEAADSGPAGPEG